MAVTGTSEGEPESGTAILNDEACGIIRTRPRKTRKRRNL